MNSPITLKGRKVVAGCAEGEALVADAMLSFWGEVDPVTGRVIAVGHPLEGCSLRNRVLVIRSTKGSSATPMVIGLSKLEGNAPAAFLNIEIDGLAALGCIVHGIPMMALDASMFDHIRTGDLVRVDADNATVTITRRDL